MTKNQLLFLVVLLLASVSLLAISVHDIQYTTIAGTDNTYPSLYLQLTVTLTNVVVTAKNYSGGYTIGDTWFVSDPGGGPWSGLFVYNHSFLDGILVGDLVNITGYIYEYYGTTELAGVTAVEIISHGNPIPEPINITTGIMTQPELIEPYENVLVQVQDVTVTAIPSASANYEWSVTDNSGACLIDDGFSTVLMWSGLHTQPFLNENWVLITGMVLSVAPSNEMTINPRFYSDLIQQVGIHSVYDVQYTPFAGNGTYPSQLSDQTITLTNVMVTAKDYSGSNTAGNKWFVSDIGGGPWSGLLINDSSYYNNILVGDIVNVTGTVAEYNGQTELGEVTSVEVISHGNIQPRPIQITTSMMSQPNQIEPYESVLVKVLGVRVTTAPSVPNYEWYVTDNNGLCQIDDGFTPLLAWNGLNPYPIINQTWVKIVGIIDYSNNEYAINPRFTTDLMQTGDGGPIYEIQYTTVAGIGNTYTSLYVGQTVTLTNVVVSAKGYGNIQGNSWFISDPAGGPWSGLYVYDYTFYNNILVGDMVNITGTIVEYSGLTEFNPSAVEVISHGNPIPGPVIISTGMMTQPEQIEPYESSLVQVQNVRVTAIPSATYYEWYVTDNSGICQIDDGFSTVLTWSGVIPPIYINQTWDIIKGIVDYSHNAYAINPRFYADLNIPGNVQSVRTVQYTTIAGDGTYPSLFAGQTVTLNVVVTAKGYSGTNGTGDKWFVSDLAGGPWSGLLINDTAHADSILVGDLVSVSGTVTENNGMTELTDVTSVSVVGHGYSVPQPIVITTDKMTQPAQIEQYEGCPVIISNVCVTSPPSAENYEWYVTDNSGQCQVDDGFTSVLAWNGLTPYPIIDQNWIQIKGIIDYSNNEYAINPRFTSDLMQTAVGMSVHDIQFTTIAGDGTFPSLYSGQTVTIANVVVTAKGYSGSTFAGDRWFVSDPAGGPWSGLYVYDNTYYNSVQVGDLVLVTGQITEYLGFTELGPLTSVVVISHGNPIPEPVIITTGMMTQPANIEPYESSLVQVQNVRVTAIPTATYYEWKVTDQGENINLAQIDDGFSSVLTFSGITPPIYLNETWAQIRGICDYNHSEFGINPRSYSDLNRTVGVDDEQTAAPINNMEVYPNPIFQNTHIKVTDNQVKAGEKVNVKIFNIRGQLVRGIKLESKDNNQFEADWDGIDQNGGKCASGIYMIRTDHAGNRLSKKIVVVH